MARLHQVLARKLQDRRIAEDEVQAIREYILEDGQLDLQDVKFLVELLCNAEEICPEFDELFFPVLKDVVLSDGKVDQSEIFYLLKMLYSDRVIRESELKFLEQLREEAIGVPEEFDDLLDVASSAPAEGWSYK